MLGVSVVVSFYIATKCALCNLFQEKTNCLKERK
jgi:hypothetical protein